MYVQPNMSNLNGLLAVLVCNFISTAYDEYSLLKNPGAKTL